MTELELIQALRQGSELAFNELVATYKNLIYNTALGIVQQAEEAEDVAQEVFIQVYKSIDSFKAESKLSTWIYRITTSKALDVVRKRKTKKRMNEVKSFFGFGGNKVEAEPVVFHHPGIEVEQKEQAVILFKAIEKLPENQKTAFILLKTENLNYIEVAEIMNTTIKALEGLMHRAKENLRSELTTYYNNL